MYGRSWPASSAFDTIYGRNLVAELRHFVHRPYLVVTMSDLWDKFRACFDENVAGVCLVQTLEHRALRKQVEELPTCNSVIGLGGGQALDVAKYVSWSRRIPLFQAPTAMSVDAAFGHRIAVRVDGQVRYIGWAVPEAVYVDFDVIRGAPPLLNRSGIGDVLCYHTACVDWKLAHERGKAEAQWPYDQRLVDEARQVLDTVMSRLDEIRDVSDEGVRTLMEALRWGGAAYHNAGWNGRHIEGVEHFYAYALEYLTGRKFVHGQLVCLGVYIGSVMQDNQPEEILSTIHRVGVDIRPEAMGITWDDAANALYRLSSFIRDAGLWYTVANETPITDKLIAHVRSHIERAWI
jgi:glycerol dehydrogenase-like iron-containing ADH family enzyme